MIKRVNHFLIIFIGMKLANAQDQEQQSPTSSNFQPSLFVVIAVLSFMFTLTLILLIYAKFCHRRASAIHNISRNQNTSNDMFGNTTRFSGIDKKVVESLPFFKFSSLKGAKQGLQCVVCLAEFEEIEVLRLLPKCKHGFHIECVDLWLERHSTCPLCRQIVRVEDLLTFTGSSSMRFLTGGQQKSDAGDVSARSFELFLERENSVQRSSRFSIGGSFRNILSAKKEEEIHIQNRVENDQEKGVLHRLNHQIVVSDVMFQNRWSDVSSSDLMFLNSEMLGIMSSDRIFSSTESFNRKVSMTVKYSVCEEDQYSIANLREEMTRKRMFEDRIQQIKGSNSKSGLNVEMGFEDSSETSMNLSLSPPRRSSLIPADKRSMSDITAMTRFKDLMSLKSDHNLRQCLADSEANYSDNYDNYVRDDLIKRRKKWFPIAKKTVQWFANREKNRSQELQQHQQTQDRIQTLDV